MGSSLTVYNDISRSTAATWTDRGLVECNRFIVPDAEYNAATLSQCQKFCTDMTVSIAGMDQWECGHVYYDSRSKKCQVYNQRFTCKSRDRVRVGSHTKRMYTQTGYMAETVYVKCGPHWGYTRKAVDQAIGIVFKAFGLTKNIGLIATQGQGGTVVAVAKAVSSQSTPFYIAKFTDWGARKAASVFTTEEDKTRAMAHQLNNGWTKLEPGQEMPRHWGSLSLLQQCFVLRANGKLFENAVYTGPWHDSNNRYRVSDYFGGRAFVGGRRLDGAVDGFESPQAPISKLGLWLLPEEDPSSEVESTQNAVVDFLVGSWDSEVHATCEERDQSCSTCVHCVACVETADMSESEECERCSNECSKCLPELPCLLEDFVMDAKALQGEDAVPPQDVVPCLEACQSCLSGDTEDCIECEGCETTIKRTADLLIFEAENRELWESQQEDEMVAPTFEMRDTREDGRANEMAAPTFEMRDTREP